MFTDNFKFKENLQVKVENFNVRKKLYFNCIEHQFLRGPTGNTYASYGSVIRKKNERIFTYVSIYLHTNFSTLQLKSFLRLRNNCEPGPR